MGYTTDFEGKFLLDPPLSQEHQDYLTAFSETRRMCRDVELLKTMDDPKRSAVELPLGEQGEFYVGSEGHGFMGQGRDVSIVDYNCPPRTQPSLWCQWLPSEDGEAIIWDGGEKFYCYVGWIEYIIKNFLNRWGYKINGEVRWRGENFQDLGMIAITNNTVEVLEPTW
jgi:hypothetical protein